MQTEGERWRPLTKNDVQYVRWENSVQEGEGVKCPETESEIEREGNLAFRHCKACDLSDEAEH